MTKPPMALTAPWEPVPAKQEPLPVSLDLHATQPAKVRSTKSNLAMGRAGDLAAAAGARATPKNRAATDAC